MDNVANIDVQVVKNFGEEWTAFNQSTLSEQELQMLFERYFHIFPKNILTNDAKGFDLGCGSGRWAKFIAPLVGKLYCIDPSAAALEVAKKNVPATNVEFICADVSTIPLDDNSMDFGYSLGVLHHVPDTQKGIASCVRKLKPGAPLLLYLYYAFDNRPVWFRTIWKISDIFRRIICVMPHPLKIIISTIIAATVYLPLSRFSRIMEKRGQNVSNIPLSTYRNLSFYTMRTDSYDRFCTRLEQRFTRVEIKEMMEAAGLTSVRFYEDTPFWCAAGIKSQLYEQ